MNWLVWLYAIGLFTWYVLYRRFGDRLWWLALLTPFVPLLFWLLIPLFGAGLLLGGKAWYSWVPLLLATAVVWLTLRQQLNIVPNKSALPRNRNTVRIMSFNLWWMSHTAATAIVPEHTDAPPHIVLLQELTPQMAQLINSELGESYPHRHYSIGTTSNPVRLGILSRYPIEAIDTSHLNQPDFRVSLYRVTLPRAVEPKALDSRTGPNESVSDRQTLLVYNIHPRATNAMRYWREGGHFSLKVRRSFANRLAHIQTLIADAQQQNEPLIIAGDFNSTPFSDVYRAVSQAFTDTHVVAGTGLGNTFPLHNADLKGLPLPRRFMRLDMIFCSKNITVHNCSVSKEHGESDHAPVLATIEI